MNLENWFMGVVEDDSDPLRMGRVKVRCYGYHTPDRSLLPSEDLPWTQTIHPVTAGPGNGGSGTSPTPLLNSIVFGVFYDGNDRQTALILGILPGGNLPNSQYDSVTGTGFGVPNPTLGPAIPSAGHEEYPSVNSAGGISTTGRTAARETFQAKDYLNVTGNRTPARDIPLSSEIGDNFAKAASGKSDLGSATQTISQSVKRILPTSIGILKATTHSVAKVDSVTAGEIKDGTMERVGGNPLRSTSGDLYRGLESDIPTVAINPLTFKRLYGLPQGTSYSESKRIMHETKPIIFVESNLFPNGKLFQIAGSGPASERLDFFSSNQEQFDFLKTQFSGLTSISVVPPELFKKAMGDYKLGAKDLYFGTVEMSIGEISQLIIDRGIYENEEEEPRTLDGSIIQTAEEFHTWATSRGVSGITVNAGSNHNIQNGTIFINKSMFGSTWAPDQKGLIVTNPSISADWDNTDWGGWISYNLGATGRPPVDGLPPEEIANPNAENAEEPTISGPAQKSTGDAYGGLAGEVFDMPISGRGPLQLGVFPEASRPQD